MTEPAPDYSLLFIELGGVAVGLAVLARLARRWGLSSISLFLLAGLAFGKGGIAPLNLTKDFIQLGAEIGVLLLLFMLGLEYTGHELAANLHKGFIAGIFDFVLNFPPGLVAVGWLATLVITPAVAIAGFRHTVNQCESRECLQANSVHQICPQRHLSRDESSVGRRHRPHHAERECLRTHHRSA